MIKQNWDLTFTIYLAADEEGQAAALLREVAKCIETGKMYGGESYCAGTYDYREFHLGPDPNCENCDGTGGALSDGSCGCCWMGHSEPQSAKKVSA